MVVLEQEMKIPVPTLTPIRQRLAEAGARRLHPQLHEGNWVLDDPSHTLAAAGRLLRVRRAGDTAALTVKEPGTFAGGIKSRVELETAVGSAEQALAILAALGFVPVRRYEKRREGWSLGGVTVALDETPMGAFVELEGESPLLEPAAVELGLDPRAAVRGTYLDLWAAFRAAHPGAPEDMVFASEPAVRPI
ncbi:MAG: class IV adenylate cyclase [Thermoanaerobaculaceae bacterium]|nr:class IV adenylate cyclase [Thermoanaerobaculaceae bacterium]